MCYHLQCIRTCDNLFHISCKFVVDHEILDEDISVTASQQNSLAANSTFSLGTYSTYSVTTSQPQSLTGVVTSDVYPIGMFNC